MQRLPPDHHAGDFGIAQPAGSVSWEYPPGAGRSSMCSTNDAAGNAEDTTMRIRSVLLVFALALRSAPSPVSAADVAPKPAAKPAATEVAILAGGCFWGLEDLLRKQPGVVTIEVGYTGGWLDNPKYDDTHDSKSGHAESVRIEFDPKKTSY